jgi:hypothetical protein
MSVDPRTIAGALVRPAARVQPGQHQNRSDPHEADAEGQSGSCRSAQGEAEPGHQQAHQGQEVHAEENVSGEHYAAETVIAHVAWTRRPSAVVSIAIDPGRREPGDPPAWPCLLCAKITTVAHSAQTLCPACRQMVFVFRDKIIHRTVGMRFLPLGV